MDGPHFNILSREQLIHQSMVLEASAGTGKTFSIEHLVARLLIEPDPTYDSRPLPLEKILVMTFTRAATSELQQRIRETVEKCYLTISAFLRGATEEAFQNAKPLDFLLALLEGARQSIEKAKQNLEHALFCFDEAQIFTIHGFCFRSLNEAAWEVGLGTGTKGDGELLDPQLIHQAVRDFLRTELDSDLTSPSQMKRLIKSKTFSPENLIPRLASLALSPIPIEEVEGFCELLHQFNEGLARLDFTPERFESIWLELAPAFKEIMGPKAQKLSLEKLQRFCSILKAGHCSREHFDRLILDDAFPFTALDPDKVKGTKKAQAVLNSPLYRSLRMALQSTIATPWKKAGAKDHILACLANRCQIFLKHVFDLKEVLTPDHILEKMWKAVQEEAFASHVREKYHVAIIDEFQDTDPLQWSIFRTLFRTESSQRRLYLVGDPKQSIYAFRRADIYTYLKAAEDLTSGTRAVLDTNFRSTPKLVNALNSLFHPKKSPRFIVLPKTEKTLICPGVKSGSQNLREIEDGRGAIHCWGIQDASSRAAEKKLLPVLAQEILTLQKQHNIPFREQAILVRDRYQSEAVMSSLQKYGIPSLARRGESLVDSPALLALEDVLDAVLRPRSLSAVKVALGGRIIGWNQHEIQEAEQTEAFGQIIQKFLEMRSRWFEHGFGPFWRDFESEMIGESLMTRTGGPDLYQALLQLVELLLEKEPKVHGSPEGLLHELRSLRNLTAQEKEALKLKRDPTQDAVQVLTMHISKGLEFGVVYAIGVMNRTESLREGQLLLHRSEEEEKWLVSGEHPQEKKEFLNEADAEKARQLYVTFTRAKYRLYIPLLLDAKAKNLNHGEASPLDLFLAQFNQPPTDFRGLYERIGSGNLAEPFMRFVEQYGEKEGISLEWMPEESPEIIPFVSHGPAKVVAPPQVVVQASPLRIGSFTSLAQRGGDPLTIADPPSNFECEEKTIHNLPAGSETGILLHELLEFLDFRNCVTADGISHIQEMVTRRVKKTHFEGWEAPITSMLVQAGSSRLGGDFCLAEVDPKKMKREMDFLFEESDPSGFLRGVMDLVFMHEGKYYLLDWKTNWLGPNVQDYSDPHLAGCMEHHEYHLQAEIYGKALEKYLNWVEKRPFKECFGGTLYVFLRGLAPTSGVFALQQEVSHGTRL